MADKLPPKEEFSEWYNEILFQAEIMDVRYPAKGVYVWFPFGQSLKRQVYSKLRSLLDEDHDEVDFPVLIPEEILNKEGKHIAGFEDEVFWVTHGGRRELEERLALRPTSETPMYTMFDLWIRSHADLPLNVYQIVDVWRSETEHTRPLIRLREITSFKEAHTAHKTPKEASNQVDKALKMYKKFYNFLGVPFVATERPEWDKFPGAEHTYALDTLMPDGRALQIATAHNLGQNFSRAFDVDFEDKNGDKEYVYQTSYGISERCIAALISIHGDDNGLVLPSDVAPTQIAIIPIIFEEKEKEIKNVCQNIKENLKELGLRVDIDYSDKSPGAKYYKWELKGTPVRIEVGPDEVQNNQITLVNRKGEKSIVDTDSIIESVQDEFKKLDNLVRDKAEEGLENRTSKCASYDEADEIIGDGFVKIGWCGVEECGKKIEDRLDADMLGSPIDQKESKGSCIECEKEIEEQVLMAKTY